MSNIGFEEILSQVKEFHESFGIDNKSSPTVLIGKEEVELRHRLMEEENNEYIEAAKNNDLVEVADALGDMLYILCGTILKHGMQDVIIPVFQEIQRANMSKLDENGMPIFRADGKVMKSSKYQAPNIEKVLFDFKNKLDEYDEI